MRFWLILMSLLCVERIQAFFNDLPCNFLDSIDISNGTLQANNSIIYSGIEYQVENYGKINFILNDEMNPITVKPYFRGCPCQIKSCIRLCCPHGFFVDTIEFIKDQQQQNINCRNHSAARNVMAEIVHESNISKTLNLDENFTYVNRICKTHYYADEFNITEKGHLLFENELVNHREYCLKVRQVDDSIKVEAMICYDQPDEPHVRYSTLPYLMMLSAPLMIATILVYVCIPELLNLCGKCLVCYLISLTTFYITLSYVYLNAGYSISSSMCTILAYTIYFAYLSTIIWLNVISYDFWKHFRTNLRSHSSDGKQFIRYFVYVWGLSIFFLTFAYSFDTIETIPNYLRPGFGTERCFLNETPLSKFLFYYLPICVIYTMNVVFSILTAMEIRRAHRHVDSLFSPLRNQTNLDTTSYNFTLYLRLFIVTGISWSVDAFAFIHHDSIFFYLTDICNSLQGVFIFILFIMKPRVLRLIKNRWCELTTKLFQSEQTTLRSSIVSIFSNNEEVAQNNNGVQLKQFVSKEYSSN